MMLAHLTGIKVPSALASRMVPMNAACHRLRTGAPELVHPIRVDERDVDAPGAEAQLRRVLHEDAITHIGRLASARPIHVRRTPP